MKLRTIFAATLVATGALTLTQAARAAGETVGVSWSNFQEERWKTDEAAIKAALEKAGLKYARRSNISTSLEHKIGATSATTPSRTAATSRATA